MSQQYAGTTESEETYGQRGRTVIRSRLKKYHFEQTQRHSRKEAPLTPHNSYSNAGTKSPSINKL